MNKLDVKNTTVYLVYAVTYIVLQYLQNSCVIVFFLPNNRHTLQDRHVPCHAMWTDQYSRPLVTLICDLILAGRHLLHYIPPFLNKNKCFHLYAFYICMCMQEKGGEYTWT